MSGPQPRRTKAAAAAETRAALLEAGAELLREQPVGTLLNQLKAPEVARRAGRTPGAFFHHWPDQETYQRELLEHVLGPDRMPTTAAAQNSVLRDVDDGVELEELVRRNARANFEGVRTDPYVPLIMGLWAKQGQDDQVRDLLRRHYQSVTRRLVPAYEALFAAQGWEPRPPFTIEMFAVTLTALVEGLTVRAAVDPDAVPLELPTAQSVAKQPLKGQLDQGPWDLFSAVALALLPTMTVPTVERDSDIWLNHEDVRGVIHRLRDTGEGMIRHSSSSPNSGSDWDLALFLLLDSDDLVGARGTDTSPRLPKLSHVEHPSTGLLIEYYPAGSHWNLAVTPGRLPGSWTLATSWTDGTLTTHAFTIGLTASVVIGTAVPTTAATPRSIYLQPDEGSKPAGSR